MSILKDMARKIEKGEKIEGSSLDMLKEKRTSLKSPINPNAVGNRQLFIGSESRNLEQNKETVNKQREERTAARAARIKEIDDETSRIKNSNAYSGYVSANREAAVARRSAGAVTPKQIKTADKKRDNAKKEYDKANAKITRLATEKSQLTAEQKIDDIAGKYNIDVNGFSYSDLGEWARNHNHNFSINSNGGAVISPKKTATLQEKEEAKILEAIAFDTANRKAAVEAPILTSAITVAGAPVRGVMGAVSTVEDSRNVAKGEEIDVFSLSKRPARMTNMIRETVDKEYASKWFGGAELPIVGNVGSALYNVGMSMGDNAVNMAVGAAVGNVASAVGLPASATTRVVSGVTSGLMASDATVNSIIANKERGLSDGKALGLGIASGMIELATEKYSIEKIIENPADTLKKVIIKGMAAEGTEEMSSEALNKVMDGIVNQGNSEMQIAIKEYIKAGHSKKEAVFLAWGDVLSDVLGAGITGAFSGMAMGGTFNTVNKITTINDLNRKTETINRILGNDNTLKPLSKGATEQEIQQRVTEIQDRINNSSDYIANAVMQLNAQSGGAVGRFGLSGQKAFDANYREGQNEENYTKGFTQFYRRGHIGQSFEQANNELKGTTFDTDMTADQKLAAYSAGVNDAKASLAAEKAAVKYVTVHSGDAGIVENDAAKKVDAESLEQIDRFARVLGSRVIFEEDIEGVNGYIDADGNTHISLNAENPTAVVASHEMTHRMQQLAPESYRAFRNYAFSVNSSDAEVIRGAYQRQSMEISEEGIMDEVAARYAEKIIRDPESMQKFVDDALNGKIDTSLTVAENRNILQRMLDAIRNLINRIRKSKAEKKAAADKGITLSELEQAERLLKNALRDSAKVVEEKNANAHKSEKDADKGSEGKKYSVKVNGKTEVVFERSFEEQVNEVLSPESDVTDGNHVFVCKRTSIMKQFGFSDLPTLITKGHLRDIHHPEDGINNKYHGMDEQEIYLIPYILDNPAMIFKSISDKNPDAICFLSDKLDSKKRPIQVVIEVNGEGHYNEVKIDANIALSAYGKDGFKGYLKGIDQKSENVMYINQKRTQELLKGEGLQLPARLSKLRFNSIIHKVDDFVNIKTKLESKKTNSNVEVKYSDSKKSLKMDDVLKQNETLKKAYTQLRAEFAKLKNGKKVADTKRIATVVKNILDDNGFSYSNEKLTEQFEGLTADAQAIIEGRMDFETFAGKVKDVARAVIDEGTRSDSVAYQESKAVRDYLRTTAISISEADRNNLGDEYETIRKGTFGRLRLVKEGGTPIDVAYQEMSELFPEYFSTETEVGASAQLRQIVDVLDGLQSLKTDPFSGYADEAADWLSGMMIDKIFNEVFVSGSTGKVDVSVDMKALRESMGDNLQKIMNRERTWRTREYNKLQKQFEKKTKNYTEARQKAIKIRQVKLHAERLSKALINPSERFAVPEFLKAPVAEFLSCIDMSSDRMGDKTREQLSDLMSAYKAMAEQEYELNMVIDPDLYNNLQDISDSIKTLETTDKRLSDLPLATLEKLRTAVMAMEASLRNYNRAFREGKAVQIDALAEAAVSEIMELRKENKKNSQIPGVKNVSDLMNYDMLNPWDYFHQMGGTFEELYMGLREGENKQIKNLALAKENMEKIMKQFEISPKEISGKKAKAQEFTLTNGDKVELTKAQIMSLHLLWRQNASHEHILEGGFRPAEIQQKLVEKKGEETKLVTSVSEDYSSVRPTLEDVAAILDTLSENEKKFAESISQFFTEECAEWGNEVAMQLYGYKKFNTPNYFPIVSDKMYLQEDFGVSADSTIKNTAFTKKRVKHANNPVIIEDIFDVYARHTSDMAKYNAYVLPLQDIQRVFNSSGFAGENNVKALIGSKYGKKAITYFSKLMNDINAGIKNDYGNAFASKMVSQYKKAKMGANLRVVVQQPMSYIRAAALMDTKYLVAANGHKVDINKVFKYSPIAQWKDWGFFSIDTGKSMYDLMTGKKELSDYTMALAGKADEATWKKIWAAVELETADKHPEMSKTGEKFYKLCGKRFDEIIDRTQVVDSTLHRSQILRSPDTLTKMSVSFMSEPMKTYNLLRTAVVDAVVRGDKKGLARTIAVTAVSSIALACVTGLYDTLTGDEDEEFWKNFTENLIGDYTGMIPYVKDVASIIEGYDVKRMDMQGISDVINAFRMLASEKYTLQYKIANMSMKVADIFGVPASSFKKSVYDTVIKNIFKGLNNSWIDYSIAKQMYPVNGKMKGEFLNILFEAYCAGNKKQYDKIFADMLKEGVDPKSIEGGLLSRYKKSGMKETFSVPWNNKSEIPQKETPDKFDLEDLTESQYTQYESYAVDLEAEVIAEIEKMKSEFTEEDYNKMLRAAYDYVQNAALEKTAPEEYEIETEWILNVMEAEEKYGIEPSEYIRYREEYGITSSNLEKFGEIEDSGIDFEEYLEFKDFFAETKADKDANGKSISGSKKAKVVNHLNGMDLTVEEWDALYFEVAGYKK